MLTGMFILSLFRSLTCPVYLFCIHLSTYMMGVGSAKTGQNVRRHKKPVLQVCFGVCSLCTVPAGCPTVLRRRLAEMVARPAADSFRGVLPIRKPSTAGISMPILPVAAPSSLRSSQQHFQSGTRRVAVKAAIMGVYSPLAHQRPN